MILHDEISAYELIIDRANHRVKQSNNPSEKLRLVDSVHRAAREIDEIHRILFAMRGRRGVFTLPDAVDYAAHSAEMIQRPVAVWRVVGKEEFYVTRPESRLRFLIEKVKKVCVINSKGEKTFNVTR